MGGRSKHCSISKFTILVILSGKYSLEAKGEPREYGTIGVILLKEEGSSRFTNALGAKLIFLN